jgi:hypothetical protein
LGFLSLSQAFEVRHFGNSKNRQTTDDADATDGPRPLLIRLYPHCRGQNSWRIAKIPSRQLFCGLRAAPVTSFLPAKHPPTFGYGAAGAKKTRKVYFTCQLYFASFLYLVGTIFCEPSVLSVQSGALGEQVRAIRVEALGTMRKIDGSYHVSMHKHCS